MEIVIASIICSIITSIVTSLVVTRESMSIIQKAVDHLLDVNGLCHLGDKHDN